MLTGVTFPSLDGATGWLNSPPLAPEDLRGRVVLVNFWTLTCINWLRQEPYVRAWARTYEDDGLTVLGVHTPEFSFEQEQDRVRLAAHTRDIEYPVALDNGFMIWRAFDNHYWPALYFIDRQGVIRDHHFGEGRYDESERVLQRLLGVERDPVLVAAVGVEAAADWEHLRSPETYLGYGRSALSALPEHAALDRGSTYRAPERLPLNRWALDGAWTIGPESVVLAEPEGGVTFRYHARDAHLVMSAGAEESIPFRVLVDGSPPGASRGVDVDEDGHGELDAGRMYQLVRESGAVRDRTLEVTFLRPGAELYVFTFG
jgi:thiol-disulfide isomerase/thioredoxin